MGNLYKSTLKSGSIMSGHYRYLDVFQIIESTKASSIHDGKYLDIEYNQAYANVIHGKVDRNDEDAVFYENRMRERAHLDFLKELISLLSIVTNQYYDLDFDKELNVRPPDQESIGEFSDASSSPEIRKDPCRVMQRQNFTNSFVSIHPSADDFLRTISDWMPRPGQDMTRQYSCTKACVRYFSRRPAWLSLASYQPSKI